MGWRVTLSDNALEDLEAAVAFLATISPVVAERIGSELVEVIFSLDNLPLRGAVVKARPGLRKFSHRLYLIYYKPDEATGSVTILRIWDGRRDPQRFKI